MKHYSTPKLVVQGDVVALTQGPIPGHTDPDGVTVLMPSGSIGFSL